MTREEAHRILSNGLVNAPSEHEWCVAFEMAIKALSQEPQCTEHPCLGTLCRYYKEPYEQQESEDK